MTTAGGDFLAREKVLSELDRNIVTVLDWFVLEGGQHDETALGEENLDELGLRGVRYFVGEPTSDLSSGDVLEIAAMITEHSPLGPDALRALVAPAVDSLGLADPRLFAEFPCGDAADVWICLRLTQQDLHDPDILDARLRALTVLADAATEALR